MAEVILNNDNFKAEVLDAKGLVLVDFWATWCGPCMRQGPVVEELADELEGQVKVGKVNVDEEAALALKYQIMSIPTLVVMKKGVFEGKSIGVQDKDEVLRLLAL